MGEDGDEGGGGGGDRGGEWGRTETKEEGEEVVYPLPPSPLPPPHLPPPLPTLLPPSISFFISSASQLLHHCLNCVGLERKRGNLVLIIR